MRTPWFMHAHQGVNTLVGAYPTPVGVYMRSNADGLTEVTFYPMDTKFENGASRVVTAIALLVDAYSDAENAIDEAVERDLAERLAEIEAKGAPQFR